MRYLIIMFIIIASAIGATAQTNATYKNLDVRNLARIRGAVGIGVTAPAERLEIDGNMAFEKGDTRFIFINENTPDGGNHLGISSGFGTVTGTSYSGNIYIFPLLADFPGNVLLNTDPDGNWTGGFTGIGVAVPGEMLDVGGKIKVQVVDTLFDGHPVVLWDESDSTLSLIEWDVFLDLLSSETNYWYLDDVKKFIRLQDTTNTLRADVIETDHISSFTKDIIYNDSYTFDTLEDLVNQQYALTPPLYFNLHGNWSSDNILDTNSCVSAVVYCVNGTDTTFNLLADIGGITSIEYDGVNDLTTFYFGTTDSCTSGYVICLGGGSQVKGYSSVTVTNHTYHITTTPVTIEDPLTVEHGLSLTATDYLSTSGITLGGDTKLYLSAHDKLVISNSGKKLLHHPGYSTYFGEESALYSSAIYSCGIGGASLSWNTGNFSNAMGYCAGKGNSGIYSNAFGAWALQYNTGENASGFGHLSLENNSGDYSSGLGAHSLNMNKGDYSNGIGYLSLMYNAGNNVLGAGCNSLYLNTGDFSVGIGDSTGFYNEGDYNIAIGHGAFNSFNLNSSGEKTFSHSNIILPDTIIISAHSFGSTGTYVNLKYTQGTSTIPGITNGAIIRFKVISADTLQFISDIPTNAGSGTGHELTPQYVYSNSIAIGYNSEPSSSNQVVIGNSSTIENILFGTVKITPMSEPSGSPIEGTIYYDSDDHTLKVWNGSEWKNCW